MRKLTLLAAAATVLLVLLGTGAFASDDQGQTASLNGYNEVVGPGSISTTGRGQFTARIDEGAHRISYRLTYTLENPATFAHIHFAQQHVGGGVVVFLCSGGDKQACPSGVGSTATVTGVIDPADVIGPESQGIEPGSFAELVRAMRAGATYVNVHSSRFPAGEIRGQIGAGVKGEDEGDKHDGNSRNGH
jgi:CHRD domain-containing protein